MPAYCLKSTIEISHSRENGNPVDVCYMDWAPASAGVTCFRGGDEFTRG